MESLKPVGRACGLAVLLLGALACTASGDVVPAPPAANNKTLYDFHDLVDIRGQPADLATYRGNVSLVINVASFWSVQSH